MFEMTGIRALSILPTAPSGARQNLRAPAPAIANGYRSVGVASTNDEPSARVQFPYPNYNKREYPFGHSLLLELVTGIEPATCSLRMSCSAIEPHQHQMLIYFNKKPIAGQHFL